MAGISGLGRRVLVVDDAEAIRSLIRRALSAHGYDVDLAASLAQARGMNPSGYDALLVDGYLGHERGAELIEELRAANPAMAGRCMVLTGASADALPEGVRWLAKPFQLDDLIEAVGALNQPDTTPTPPVGQLAVTPYHARDAPGPAPRGADPPVTGEPPVWRILRILRRIRARERHELVGFLHDGPLQDLAAATLELQMATAAAQPSSARREAGQHLATATESLRWLVDGRWPFMLPETNLTTALEQRTAWLLASPATVDIRGQPAGLSAGEIPAVVDIVELILLGIVPDDRPAQAHVVVRAGRRTLHIELSLGTAAEGGQAITDPVAAGAEVAELASALGVTSPASPPGQPWRARIALPRQPGASVPRPPRLPG